MVAGATFRMNASESLPHAIPICQMDTYIDIFNELVYISQ